MKPVMLCVAVVCFTCLVVAAKPPAKKMSVDEAIRRILDVEYMEKIRVSHADGVADAFKGLSEKDANAALALLLPLLEREDLGFGHFHLGWAFTKLGTMSIRPLLNVVEKGPSKKLWQMLLQTIPRSGIDVVEPLLPLLSHENAEIRCRSALLLERACGRAGRATFHATAGERLPPAADAVSKLLMDESADVAVQSASTLTLMGKYAMSALGALTDALSAESPDVRGAAVKAIAALGKDAAGAVPELVNALDDPSVDVCINAADALVAVGDQAVVIPALIKALASPDYVAIETGLALARIGVPAIEGLTESLREGDARQRRMAAFTLGKIGPDAKPAVSALGVALKDKNAAVRVNAIDALVNIGDQAAVKLLVGSVSDKSRVVRYKALTGLELLASEDAEIDKLADKARTRLLKEAKPQEFERPQYAFKDIDYMIGGPLNGAKLPKYRTQHGEEPGYPGSIEALRTPDKYGNILFTGQGQQAELNLYPGAVEHYRSYWFKYIPVRTFFDVQSQIKSWVAPDIPGAAKKKVAQYEEPVYWVGRHGTITNTGFRNKAVPVLRYKPGAQVFESDLGMLPIGMYAVRVVGAVPTEQLQSHRKPLYLHMAVNDRIDGAQSTYKLRMGYVDEFYSIAEVYFHAVEKRRFKARIWIGKDSQVDLLVHNIILDDALVGIDRRPFKTRMTLVSPKDRGELRRETVRKWEKRARGKKWTPIKPYTTEEQWVRDEMFWKMWPRLNTQPGANYGLRAGYQADLLFGTGDGPGDTRANEQKESERRWGKWAISRKGQLYYSVRGNQGLRSIMPCMTLLANDKLRSKYTFEDLATQKPLPDPYPYKDDGTGLYFPPEKKGELPQYFCPIANAVSDRLFDWNLVIKAWINTYHGQHNIRAGRDAAIALIRMTYDMPGIDPANAFAALLADPGPWGREHRCRRRTAAYFPWGPDPEWYEKLFDVIYGNEELAASVSRFIPWIKSSADVVTLLDSYLVQNHSKRVLRYQYLWDNAPMLIVNNAMILDDAKVTEPWLQWLFNRAYIYPNPVSGIQDLISTANDRDGAGYIAAWAYCIGEEASKNGDKLERYIALGGNPKYDLRDPKQYPRVTAACYWPLRTLMAGLYFPRVGDVNGPDKCWGHCFTGFEPRLRRGWKWTKDPIFAWMIKHHYGRKEQSDTEWASVEKAAATIVRAPYLTQPSRVVANWFGLLEAGQEHDDPRFRRAAMLRVGLGWGHHHNDSLDLQLYAHGYPMTIDGGQRPKYSRPHDRSTYVHNLVEVDGKQWMGHSWVKTMCDPPGSAARYMQAEAVPTRSHTNVNYLRRQVAMIDVDKGSGSQPIPPGEYFPGKPLKQEGVISPNSYTFDVVRVAGGTNHTYCFHAMIDDEMTVNVTDRLAYDKLPGHEQQYLSQFKKDEPRLGGDAPDTVVATWRYTRDSPAGGEKNMNPLIWDQSSPRKFTRLHVLGQEGARVLSGSFDCFRWKYRWSQLFVRHRGNKNTERVFPAIIEPYVGDPFITGTKLLAVKNNDADAGRAVAVQVKTKNGQTDIVFADGRPDKVREVSDVKWQVTAEFAYVSTDAKGLRNASLTAGTLLKTPEVSLELSRRQYVGKITEADYLEKTFRIDSQWPAFNGSELALEIGSGEHWTTYMTTGIVPASKGSVISLRNGATLYASRVLEVDEKASTVYCALMLPFVDHSETSPVPGLYKDLVVCNREMTRFWRADYLGGDRSAGKFGFKVDGPVAAVDFAANCSLKVMEYGVGDTVRIPAFASLRRVDDTAYELTANTDLKIRLSDGKTREIKLAELVRNNGKLRIAGTK